jgi:3-deoxy-manno-octulosonate cytidylyltransferase (CMP-KDO synthetase)
MIKIYIPARLSSARFPGKPLVEVEGMPHIVRLGLSVRRVFHEYDLYVVTDSIAIAWAVENVGLGAIHTGPAANGTERVARAMNDTVGDSEDLILNIQGDLLLPDDLFLEELREVIESIPNNCLSRDWATFVVSDSCRNLPSAGSVWAATDATTGRAVDFRRMGTGPEIAEETPLSEHVGLYLYSKHILNIYRSLSPSPSEIERSLEQMRLVDAGHFPKIFEIKSRASELNTEEDYIEFCRNLAQRKSI